MKSLILYDNSNYVYQLIMIVIFACLLVSVDDWISDMDLVLYLISSMWICVIYSAMSLYRLKYPKLWMNQFNQFDTHRCWFFALECTISFCYILSPVACVLPYWIIYHPSTIIPRLCCYIAAYQILTFWSRSILVLLLSYRQYMSNSNEHIGLFYPFLPITQETLDYKEIILLQQIRYRESQRFNSGCSICLTDFNPSEFICELQCKHCYHSQCIEEWRKLKATCPLCGAQLIRDTIINASNEG